MEDGCENLTLVPKVTIMLGENKIRNDGIGMNWDSCEHLTFVPTVITMLGENSMQDGCENLTLVGTSARYSYYNVKRK